MYVKNQDLPWPGLLGWHKDKNLLQQLILIGDAANGLLLVAYNNRSKAMLQCTLV